VQLRRRQAAAATRADIAPSVPSLGNGWTTPIYPTDHPALLEILRDETVREPAPDMLIGWDGVRTRVEMLPFAPDELAGTVSSSLPIPDDGYRSEAEEYVALAQAISTADRTFRIVEVGAGWAPWSVAGIVIARRKGLVATGIAVEADDERSTWAVQHAVDNDVAVELVAGTPDEIAAALREPWGDTELRVVRAAGWHTRTTLQFPDLDSGDMGGAIWTLPGTDVDYRGAHLSHHEVPSVTMASLLDAPTVTDLLHVDVQGVESQLLITAADDIQAKVRLMAVGTTDRGNEGRLQEFFLPRGWGLAIDEPCTTHFTMTHPSLAGFTVQDGLQLWENPFLRADFPA
jgi:hypothetical protein